MNLQLSTKAPDGACEAARCPLCGGPNECRHGPAGSATEPCWCEREVFPAALLARVPVALARGVCVCRNCVGQEIRTRPPARTGAGDSYADPDTGFAVFTEAYHLRRGYCCENGCRHCPFENDERQTTRGGSQPRPLARVATVARSVAPIVALLGFLLAPFFAVAAEVTDDFLTDPFQRGWRIAGDTNLFRWAAAPHRFDLAWNSAASNSFLVLPLGRTLTTDDDFAFEFDLQLGDAAPRDPDRRPATVQIGLGLVRLARLPEGNPGRLRGAAQDLVEFDWFPGSVIPGYGENEPSVSPAVFGGGTSRAFSFDNFFDLADGATWRVRCVYRARERQLVTTLRRDGADAGPVNPVRLADQFASFAVDAFAVMAWNESATALDSLAAHGRLSRLVLELPDPPIGTISSRVAGQVSFTSVFSWRYTLEAGGDLKTWAGVAGAAGTGGPLTLTDPDAALVSPRFYRVRAARP